MPNDGYSSRGYLSKNARSSIIGGSNKDVQYNSNGVFEGDARFQWCPETGVLTIDGDIDLSGKIDGIDLSEEVVRLTGDQEIDGVKTFLQFPVTPRQDPQTDFQVANKRYVDSQLGDQDSFVYTEIQEDESVTIPVRRQMTVHGELIIDGELIAEGELVIEP